MRDLEGHVAFVTGAAGGIGQATAILLAERGANVAIADLDGAGMAQTIAQIEGAGGTGRAYQVDVGRRDDFLAAVADWKSRAGQIDSIIASAMWIRYEAVEDVRDDIMDRMLAVGLKSVFWAAQAASAHMDPARGGVLVPFASPVADRGHRGTSVYTAVKGGVAALTKQLAMEFAPRRIRVNAVTPGSTPTPGAHRVVDEAGWEVRRKATPLGRLAEPRDIAEAVAFLISPKASFITGEILHVDGGLTAGAF